MLKRLSFDALDDTEVQRFVSCLLAKEEPGALRLGSLQPYDSEYIRCRSPGSMHSTPRSPNIVLEGTILVDAVNCGTAICNRRAAAS